MRLVLVVMIGVLMGLNAVGVFGFLTRAHLEHMMAVDLALADRTADIDVVWLFRARPSPTSIGVSPRSTPPSSNRHGLADPLAR